MVTRSVMVKAGTEYRLGQNLLNDPDCLGFLQEHVCIAHYLATKELPEREFKGIIRPEEGEWPRELVRAAVASRDPEAVIRPKVIKFADEAAFEPDVAVFDDQIVSADFALAQIEDFLQTRRSVVLVDLNKLEQPPSEEEVQD
jgi:hypothetical protein